MSGNPHRRYPLSRSLLDDFEVVAMRFDFAARHTPPRRRKERADAERKLQRRLQDAGAPPFFITSMSIVIAISSPTNIPPPSRVLLKTIPKS